jgi:hypothetical protein
MNAEQAVSVSQFPAAVRLHAELVPIPAWVRRQVPQGDVVVRVDGSVHSEAH